MHKPHVIDYQSISFHHTYIRRAPLQILTTTAMLKLLLIFTVFVAACRGRLEGLPDEATSRVSLASCIIQAALRFFDYGGILTMSLPTQEVASNRTSATLLDRILLPQLFHLSDWTLLIRNVSLPRHPGAVDRSDYYIFQIRGTDELNRTLHELIGYGNWNPHARFIVTSATEFPAREEVVMGIVHVLWSYKVLNAVVILPKKEHNVESEIYTWFPYTDGRCGLEFTKVRSIDTCANGRFFNNTDWYPNKIPDDLMGCELRVEVILWPPYVMPPGEEIVENRTYDLRMGLEVQLMNAIADGAGINISYTTSVVPQNWGFIFTNGSATGMMENLLLERTELAMGSISANNEKHRFFDHTIPYYQDSFAWCVPSAEQTKSWKNFVLIFGASTWFGIFASYLLTTLVLWACAVQEPGENFSFRKLPNCVQNMFAILLGVAAEFMPDASHMRFVALTWLIFSMIITTAYKTVLVSVLTEPTFDHQMSTVEEILTSDLQILCLKDMAPYFDSADADWKVRKLLDKWTNCLDMEKCLDRTAFKRDSAVAIPRIHLDYVFDKYVKSSGDSWIYCTKESIVSFPIEMLMVKGHPLNARINDLLVRVVGAGLLDKWMTDIKDYAALTKETGADSDTDDSGNQILSIGHLLGVFVGSGLALILATFIFVLEIIVHRFEARHVLKKKEG